MRDSVLEENITPQAGAILSELRNSPTDLAGYIAYSLTSENV